MAQHFLHCEGPLPCAPGSSPFHIKGEFYRNVASSVRELDRRHVGAIKATMDPALWAFITQSFLASSMYDVLPMPYIKMAIAHALNRDLVELTSRIARSGAQMQMTSTYKTLLDPMALENFARRFVHLIERSYDFGPITITMEAQSARVSRTGLPACVAEWWSLVSVPFVTVPLEHNGAKNVRIDARVTATGMGASVPLARVDWEMTWDIAP